MGDRWRWGRSKMRTTNHNMRRMSAKHTLSFNLHFYYLWAIKLLKVMYFLCIMTYTCEGNSYYCNVCVGNYIWLVSKLDEVWNVDAFEDYKMVSDSTRVWLYYYLIYMGILKYIVLLPTQLLTPYLNYLVL